MITQPLGCLLGLGLAFAALLFSGCDENPVGRECFIGTDVGDPDQAIVASPALECPSRTCLRVPVQQQKPLPEGVQPTNMCTAGCEADDDCDRVPESPCVTGFTCAIPVVVGPFCCQRMCVCKDYLIIPDDGVPTPAACDPSNAVNTCCNLPGREDQPHCQ